LPIPDKVVKVDEMIDSIVEEVKAMLDTVWWLNNNFVVLGIEGILNMLHDEGYQELNRLRDLATSCDAAVLKDVPEDMHRLAWQIMWRRWEPHGLPEALHRLEAAHTATVSYSDN
jgi:hypothetical protein